MKRDIQRLRNDTYDVLVVGAGIYGASIAYDATLRGLKVALVEKGDFGGATSSNSLKTIHGGLRYLQDANLPLVRKMIHERRAMMRIAPHLALPLTFVMPTSKKLMKSKLVMRPALLLNDVVSFDRNRHLDPARKLPRGKVISREECLRLLPGLDADSITGAAVWHDAQIYNTERLLLSFVHGAAARGAQVANYVEISSLIREGDRVTGAAACDVFTGETFDVRAKLVINAAGAWSDGLLSTLDLERPQQRFMLSVAVNLITRQINPRYAAAVNSRYTATDAAGNSVNRSQVLIIAPWRKYSIAGTFHFYYDGDPATFRVDDARIQQYIDQINDGYPGAKLTREDVYWTHHGFLPAEPVSDPSQPVRLVRESRVHNHRREDGIDGLITVIGVKYTTARAAAEKAVNLAFEKLEKPGLPCSTAEHPLYGGDMDDYEVYLAQQIDQAGLPQDVMRHLVRTYGTQYTRVLHYAGEGSAEPLPGPGTILPAEIRYAIHEEMAQTLADVLLRRTELGSAGHPGQESVRAVASIMAEELGWDEGRIQQEIDAVDALLNRRVPVLQM